jgi:hypothetical protein
MKYNAILVMNEIPERNCLAGHRKLDDFIKKSVFLPNPVASSRNCNQPDRPRVPALLSIKEEH